LLSEIKDKKMLSQLQSFNDKKPVYKESCFQTTQDLMNEEVWRQKQIK
jgi:hypothetical protein